MSKKEVKLQNAIEKYEDLLLQIMQVEAQIKVLQLKNERLREDLEIIICDETGSDYPLFTRYDPLLEL